MINVGEFSGNLDVMLDRLAVHIESYNSLIKKVKSAMMYPMFIILVVIAVVSVMMTMIVPKLLDIFDDKSVLPASTKLLMTISEAFRGYWLLFIILLIMNY